MGSKGVLHYLYRKLRHGTEYLSEVKTWYGSFVGSKGLVQSKPSLVLSAKYNLKTLKLREMLISGRIL